MHGPAILARTLSAAGRQDQDSNSWQYNSRSDHHSKVACWGIVFDVMLNCPLLRRHIAEDKVYFGINHEMVDFVQDRKKNLDLVLCTKSGTHVPLGQETLRGLIANWNLELSLSETAELSGLPILRRAPVGTVLIALEAKACMTAHQKALPRLYDELNSSHLTVHGANDQAIAAGFAMINHAPRFLSPGKNKFMSSTGPVWNLHKQPSATSITIEKILKLPKRAKPGEVGYDAFAILVVDCVNDGSPVEVVDTPPAPKPGDIFHYASMIDRLSHAYATRFKDL